MTRSNHRDPFVKISDADTAALQGVLKQRLPRSAHEYNTILQKRRCRHEVDVYTLDGDLSASAIIMLIVNRKDYGQDINMSVPLDYVPDEYLRKALIDTKVVDWDGPYVFTSLDRVVSPVVVEVSTSVKKNSVMVNPNYQYTYDFADAQHQSFRNLREEIELRPLDKTSGSKFLVDNWKYSKDGTMEYVVACLEKSPSAGVYLDGKLVCGAIANVHGLMGLLYTDVHHRRKGFAQLCFRYLFKEMAKVGQIPCSSAQAKNYMSCNFHEKLGMAITHETDYVYHTPYTEGKIHK